MSLVDIRLDKIQVKEEGIAEGPYVVEFFIRHEPGDQDRQIIGLPTQKIKDGETIHFEGKSLKTKWIQVTEVSDEYILGAKVRPMKETESGEEQLLEDTIRVGADVVGQTYEDLFPFQSWIVADIVNLGWDAIQQLGLWSYLEEPFGEGHAVLQERKLEGETIVQRVRFDLLAGRKIEGNAEVEAVGGREGPWTAYGGGPNHGEVVSDDSNKSEELDEGEKNGFIEVLIYEKEGQEF